MSLQQCFVSVCIAALVVSSVGAESSSAIQNVVVFTQNETFAGWPANNGLWAWGDEILVGACLGGYKVQGGHNILEPYRCVLLRSTNGGQSWSMEAPDPFIPDPKTAPLPPTAIDFSNPNLAVRVIGTGYHGSDDKLGSFVVSTDRGKSWKGPWRFGNLAEHKELAGLELTPRTDYNINGPADCLFFLSARDPKKNSSDKVFVARTTDGGKLFSFVTWMVPPTDPFRAVMPSTVRRSPSKLVSVVRRRKTDKDECWIDAYCSTDDAKTWTPLGKVGDTGDANGNPPALIALGDGRLCCAYGDRARRLLIVRYSADDGKTWSPEQVIRSDYDSPENDSDFGYPRLTQRPDGNIVLLCYFADRNTPRQHIAASIWKPE
jgi:hypothetical protein